MIDFAKFSRYSKPGPRYTSYPTAIEFSEKFTYERYIELLEQSNTSGKPLSLYFHLPFCRSACYFCGCNVVFTSKEEKKERYIDYLQRELEILARHIDTTRPVTQLHFGGGTPTFFDAHQLDRIITLIRSYFSNFTPDAEISCEIDPRFLNEEQMQALVKGGFNRISFGVQDFDEQVQTAVHRIQSFEMTKGSVDLARRYGIESINIDLIYGLPYQSLATFKETLKQAIALNPDRFAVFNYAHVPWLKKTMRKIDETTLPHPADKLAIFQHTIDFMESSGYKMIGMDHFAKPADELFKAIDKGELHRNFQGYTTKGGSDLVGVGLTSIGELSRCYAQNTKDMDEYEAAIDAGRLPFERGIELSDDDLLRKRVIMEMMSNFKLNIPAVEKEFGIVFKEFFADALEALREFEAQELMSISDMALVVSHTGTLLIRNIVMPFDAYTSIIPENRRVFSKTI